MKSSIEQVLRENGTFDFGEVPHFMCDRIPDIISINEMEMKYLGASTVKRFNRITLGSSRSLTKRIGDDAILKRNMAGDNYSGGNTRQEVPEAVRQDHVL